MEICKENVSPVQCSSYYISPDPMNITYFQKLPYPCESGWQRGVKFRDRDGTKTGRDGTWRSSRDGTSKLVPFATLTCEVTPEIVICTFINININYRWFYPTLFYGRRQLWMRSVWIRPPPYPAAASNKNASEQVKENCTFLKFKKGRFYYFAIFHFIFSKYL